MHDLMAQSVGLAQQDFEGWANILFVLAMVILWLVGALVKALSKKGAQAFTIPGLCKIVVQHKPAQPAKKNVPNPFKPGEMMDVAAKPAKNIVKVRALKKLKDMA